MAKSPVPKALAKHVAQEVAAKQQRLAQEARANIALIKRRRARITEDFYDIGEALQRLKKPGVASALGHKNFGELCVKELGMSGTKAEQLISIATKVTRDDAVSFGQARTTALLALADATPEDDTPHDLQSAILKLPSGRKLDVAKASANDIKSAAMEIRAANAVKNPKPRRRGRTATPDERTMAAKLEARMRKAGLATAKVRAVAARPGHESHLRIDGVPFSGVAKLASALTKR